MANTVPSYFFSPSWDYPPPPTGPIKLGSLITSLKRPEQPLATLDPTNSFSTDKKMVEFSKEKLRQGKFSILTKFLSVLGVGVDLGAERQKSQEDLYTFTTLTTEQFIPTVEYIQKCIDSSDTVTRFLTASGYRKPLYLVTGIKTAYGSAAKTANSTTIGGNISVEVDGTVWSGGAVPLSGGPGIERKKANKSGVQWEESSDFVFAFQVWKIKVEKKTGTATGKDYKKGANLEDKRPQHSGAIQVMVKKATEAKANDIPDFEEVEVTEDGFTVSCGFVQKREQDESD